MGKCLAELFFVTENQAVGSCQVIYPFCEELAKAVALAKDEARLYREAQEAIQTREEVMAIVSHDLKNPLTATLMNAQMLLRLETTDNGMKVQLENVSDRICRSVKSMEHLITTPERVTITVGAQKHDGDVCVSVMDTGPSISAEQLPHVFERYWQSQIYRVFDKLSRYMIFCPNPETRNN